MEGRHGRNIPALSEEACALLRTKKVAVIGCGGLGGYLAEYLARIGVGAIRVVDGDVFEKTNLNRQLLSLPENMGKSKAEAAAERIRAIDPDIRAEAVPVFLTAENGASLLEGCDAALDALDGIPARKLLEKACAEAGIPCVHGAISGWVAQAAVSMPGDGLMEKLYPDHVQIRDKSVLSFTPGLCAAVQAALCVKLLAGREVEHGVLWHFDLMDQEFTAIPLEL